METPVQPSPPPEGAISFSYAGFWKRFAAHLIDQLIIGVVALIFMVPLLMMFGLGMANLEEAEVDSGIWAAFFSIFMIVILFLMAVQWLYYALMESKKGATLGKMAIGIVVTDMHGHRVSFGRATGRYFAKFISGCTIGIGYIIAGFTQQKQALHDIIAGCLVINK